jgi:general secretion pathway protein A
MGKEQVLAGPGRAGAHGKEPVSAGSGRVGENGKEPVKVGSGREAENDKERGSAGSGPAGENGKEPAVAASGRINEKTAAPILASTEMVSADKVELAETARLLAVLLDSGRVVLGRAQPAINNPRLEDKGFSSSVFEARLRKEFLARTGHDLHNLAPAPMPDGAKPLLVKLAYLMQKAVQDAQPDINKKGIGFKGFIPATFATKVASNFSKDTGLKLRQIGPPDIDPRNPDNKPDEQERQTLSVIQKSHPRVGDHVIEQQLPDKSVRVMLPLFYNKQCLACHGKPKGEIDISGYEKEGFKEGDLGGAISVILPTGNNASGPKPSEGE